MATQERIPAGTGLQTAVETVAPGPAQAVGDVRARGYWELVWIRFKRDRVAIGGGFFIIFLLLLSFVGAPIAQWILGHGPNQLFDNGVDPLSGNPVGPLSHFAYTNALTGHTSSVFFLLGADSNLGRDEFLRLLYGGQASLEVAIGATLLTMALGVIMGAIAGYYGGMVDMLVSRLSELVMAFPILLFIIALASTAGPTLNAITLGFLGNGVFTLIIVFGVFGWFYPARVVRAQVLSLREKEFVEAARMVGASDSKIIRSHLLPHLVAPIIVLATISVAQYVLAEAGLSFLGIGVQDPTSSWGNLLSNAPTYYLAQPWLMLWPGLMILLTTLSFNLLGDGLRDAFDPRGAAH
jgi:peptide/nickel transport system permease protein